MNNFDTIALLKACNQGCKYATNSMEQIYPHINDISFRKMMDYYDGKHIKIGDKCHELLNYYSFDEKDPKPMASMFSKMSTDMKLLADDSTEKIAEIMLDGCHMGIKSVGKYINKYPNASKDCRDLARKLIDTEQNFMNDLMEYI